MSDIWTGCQFELVRRQIDPPFLELAASLDDAYYRHWKIGAPMDWYGWDPVTNPKQGDPKAVFDMLTGNIWHNHELALIAKNDELAQPYPVDKINPVRDDGKRKSEVLTAQVDAVKASGFDLVATAEAAGIIAADIMGTADAGIPGIPG